MKSLVTAAVAIGVLSGGPAAQTQVYKPGSGVTNPVVVKDTMPSYTAAARRAKIQGSVEMEAIVDTAGKATEIKVTRSLDATHGLDDKAVEALKAWVFKPGTKDGKPVAVQITVEMTFTLRDGRVFDKTHIQVKPPIIVFEKKPAYTAEAMRAGIEGAIEVEGIVGADGKVTGLRVVKGLTPDLDANAIEAFTASTFKPAMYEGRAVAYRVTMAFTFHLRN